ncbi:10641_t:CDS:2, partial [Dentiscutata heterogama]
PFLDVDNDDDHCGQEDQKNSFQQQVHQLLRLMASALSQLELVGHAFETNNIQDWEDDFHPDMSFKVNETIDQYVSEMVALFRQVTVRDNQYPEAIKAQIFVQGLQPDMVLVVGLFILKTLQAAIERDKVTSLTVQLLTSSSATEDPIKKLTSVIEELVVSIKNNNDRPRENQNKNQNNIPFQGN